MNITAVHYRSRPILTNALMADYPSCEQSGFFSLIRSAKIWDDFDKLEIPGIVGVYSPSRCRGRLRYDCYQLGAALCRPCCSGVGARSTGAQAVRITLNGSLRLMRISILPTPIRSFGLWLAAATPIDDVDVLRNTWSTWLDPTQNPPEKRPYGSKALINACKEHRHLPVVFEADHFCVRAIYDKVAARWKELELPGPDPDSARVRGRR